MMNGDYATIAGGMGAVGITCTKVSEVGPAFLKARELNAAGTTCLIQVMGENTRNFSIAGRLDGVYLAEVLTECLWLQQTSRNGARTT